MSQPAIEVKNLSKVYNIGHEQKATAGNLTFRDTLVGIAKKPIELITGHSLEKEKFWALKDVSFEVEQGDAVGIIGRNGSGKSTMLKVLSRIVEPTEGEIHLRGKVASLLEVGTGFHPELTGRENIFFNGAILGMKQSEIRAKFDDIVEFSEVEKFLDTPVKFYSSGMYVRLAFAVAAHLEPDILIVDEVLAVGDAAFQEKCLGKMKDVTGQGRTVLFVSHNMGVVASLCNKSIFMQNGRMKSDGIVSTRDAIAQYLDESSATGVVEFASQEEPHLARASVSQSRESFTIEAELVNANMLKETVLSFVLYTDDGHPVYGSDSRYDSTRVKPLIVKDKKAKVRIKVDPAMLRTGKYYISLYLGNNITNIWTREKCLALKYIDANPNTTPVSDIGYLRPNASWELI